MVIYNLILIRSDIAIDMMKHEKTRLTDCFALQCNDQTSYHDDISMVCNI